MESALNKSINVNTSILFLDEIQAAPEIFAKLRWFYEEMPALAVIAAGSLLEFLLEHHTFSMSVGRIQYFFVEPLSFPEFLLAKNETHLLSAIENFSFTKPLNIALHDKANGLFKEYITIGGMPEAVLKWIGTASLENVSMVHNDLINTYRDDFSKYNSRVSSASLEDVLVSIPKSLGKKFVYSHVNPLVRTESIKTSLNLLTKARICHTIQGSYANGIPLGAEINPKLFKIIFLDVGLVSTLLGLKLYQFNKIDDILLINKGAIAEQVVGQLLRLLVPYYIEPKLYYWNRETASSSAEIDYLIQDNERLIPIEVKSGSEGKLRSLHQFMSEKPWKTAIRFYTGLAGKSHIKSKIANGRIVDYELFSLPFYLISQTYKLITM
ncbi:MAG: hypothetical protein K0R14_1801 [Burkholderiales bacterium]|nr:hypothetical protein [Burkholderiales bacterium]